VAQSTPALSAFELPFDVPATFTALLYMRRTAIALGILKAA